MFIHPKALLEIGFAMIACNMTTGNQFWYKSLQGDFPKIGLVRMFAKWQIRNRFRKWQAENLFCDELGNMPNGNGFY